MVAAAAPAAAAAAAYNDPESDGFPYRVTAAVAVAGDGTPAAPVATVTPAATGIPATLATLDIPAIQGVRAPSSAYCWRPIDRATVAPNTVPVGFRTLDGRLPNSRTIQRCYRATVHANGLCACGNRKILCFFFRFVWFRAFGLP